MSNVIPFEKICREHEFCGKLKDLDASESIYCKKCGEIASDIEKINFLKNIVDCRFYKLILLIEAGILKIDDCSMFSLNINTKGLIDSQDLILKIYDGYFE